MNSIVAKGAITGVFFLFILSSGYWLSHLGKPYNSLVFTLHKLIGLGAGVFLIVNVAQANKALPLGGITVAAVVLTVIIFILLVAAGGLLSILAEGGLMNMASALKAVITWVHKSFPYLALVSTAVTLFLLLRNP